MPNNLDLFFYIAAYITIVLALAMSDMVQSMHRLLRARDRVRWRVAPLLAIAFVFLSVLSEFFTLWQYVGIRRISFYELAGMMACPTLIALAALAVVPDEVPPEGLDLEVFYFEHRGYLYVVLLIAFLGDLVRNLLQPGAWQSEALIYLGAVFAPVLGILALLAISKNRRVHIVGVIALFAIAHVAYSHWEVVLPPARA